MTLSPELAVSGQDTFARGHQSRPLLAAKALQQEAKGSKKKGLAMAEAAGHQPKASQSGCGGQVWRWPFRSSLLGQM